MHTIFIIATWTLLLAIVIMYGHIRALNKRHRQLEISLIDDCNTSRDKVLAGVRLIREYKHLQDVDTAMVERLLKEVERLKESHIELLAKIAQYDNLAAGALSQLDNFMKDIRVSRVLAARKNVQRAMDNLKQITAEK
jgi:hypothetical protein